jgi:hypothetical protein
MQHLKGGGRRVGGVQPFASLPIFLLPMLLRSFVSVFDLFNFLMYHVHLSDCNNVTKILHVYKKYHTTTLFRTFVFFFSFLSIISCAKEARGAFMDVCVFAFRAAISESMTV